MVRDIAVSVNVAMNRDRVGSLAALRLVDTGACLRVQTRTWR